MSKIKLTICLLFCLVLANYSFAQNKLIVSDTRTVVTAPNSYAQSLEVNFKQNTTLGLPFSSFSTILGIRGWYNDSGGKGHELAFTNTDLYLRSGFDSGWESWRKILVEDVNGNVGIGSNNPVTKLDVRGTINAVDYIRSQNPDNNQAVVFLGWLNNVPRLRIGGSGEGSSSGFDIQMSGDLSVMRLLANGNVGIGTTTPSEKLSVNGTIRSKEIKVETTNWPDYVFDENYDLKSLAEIETYIEVNKHLPGMPNQQQVKEEGVNLGEMNRKLLEKVEELTLILIQERKERLLLESQVKSQQHKMELFEEKLEQK